MHQERSIPKTSPVYFCHQYLKMDWNIYSTTHLEEVEKKICSSITETNSLPLSAFDAQISGLWSRGRTSDHFLLPHTERGTLGERERDRQAEVFPGELPPVYLQYMHKLMIQRSERMEKCFRTLRVLIYSNYKGLLVFFIFFLSITPLNQKCLHSSGGLACRNSSFEVAKSKENQKSMALSGERMVVKQREAVEKAWNAGAVCRGRIEPCASAPQCPSEIHLHLLGILVEMI